MSVLYKNKTIKDPFHIPQNDITPKKSSAFVSKGQRFNHKIQNSPGPASYQLQSKNFRLPDYHIQRNKNQYEDIGRQYQWIFGSDRTSYLQNQSNPLGPGSYNMNKSLAKNNANWNKSNRFHYQKQRLSIGPGSYDNLQKSQSKIISSVFKSKSPKSFIDKMISETSLTNLHTKSIQKAVEPMFQNPEAANTADVQNSPKSNQKKSQKNCVFASNIPRFKNSKQLSEIGPGSYELHVNKKSKQSLPKIITVKNETRIIPKKVQKPLPGPGEYEIDQKTIERSIEDKGNNILVREERFHQNIQQYPGPGHYMQNKFTYLSDLKKKYNPQRPSFNSSSDRSHVESNSQNIPFGTYNVDIFDMEYRLKKKQQHIQKLKIMEVSLPAFNTKSKK